MGCKSCGNKSNSVSKRAYFQTGPRPKVSRRRSGTFRNGIKHAPQPQNGNIVADPREGKVDPSTGQLLSTIGGMTASDFEESNG